MAAPKKKTTKRVPKKTTKKIVRRKKTPLDLKKPKKNPIIEPSLDRPWESKATFNPTALEHDGKVHLIYRAIGENDMSVLGYARSDDGTLVVDRHPEAAYLHETDSMKPKKAPIVPISSGGGWGGGCEDPRMTKLNDSVYLLYTAFDGWGSVRIALTSIGLDNFLNKRWSWNEPVLISPPNEIHKNWVLFPEKIGGKFAILHSISPEIMIDYIEDLDEFDGKKFIRSVHQGSHLWHMRARGVRGVGPAPIRTELGWLVLYHAIEEEDPGRYKLWAMILDIDEPTRVLYRSKQPILEPDEAYENSGFKWGVVYACGAVVKNGTLFVYYGGADRVTCVASAKLDKFLDELSKHREPKLSSAKMKIKN